MTTIKKQHLLIPGTLAIVSAIIMALFVRTSLISDEEKAIANSFGEIAKAVEAFKQTNRVAPTRLEQLTPEYISRIPTNGINNSPVYSYERAESDPQMWSIEATIQRIPTRSVILHRSSKDYNDCVPGASLHYSYKIIEAKPESDCIVLHEQTD